MVKAFFKIDTAVGMEVELVEAIRDVDTVVDAHVIAGDFDIMTELEAETLRELHATLTREIRSRDGVGTTRCYVCLD